MYSLVRWFSLVAFTWLIRPLCSLVLRTSTNYREMEVGQDLRRSQESLESAVDVDSPHTLREPPQDGDNDGLGGSESKPSPQKRGAILNVLGVVERDTLAIAESFSSLFDSLRLALSEVRFLFIFSLEFSLPRSVCFRRKWKEEFDVQFNIFLYWIWGFTCVNLAWVYVFFFLFFFWLPRSFL